jgi:hypothetical protein
MPTPPEPQRPPGQLPTEKPSRPPTIPTWTVTEGERRQGLVDALAARRTAQDALRAAEQAHQRGLDHQRRCQSRMAAYATLDAQVTEATLAALRNEAGRVDELPAELRALVGEREVARVDLLGADEAIAVLLREMTAATTRWQQSDRRVKLALGAVVAVGIAKLREKQHQLESELQTVINMAYSVVVSEDNALGRALVADPLGAPVEIEVDPDAKPAAMHAVAAVMPSKITIFVDGKPEVITEEEFWRRQREKRLAEANQAEPFSVRELRASETAQRGVVG